MSPVALHHVDRGPRDAPVVVLAGSLGTTYEMWAPQIEPLSQDHRVIAFDHRGHGASPEPAGPYSIADLAGDIEALVDGLDRFTYVGLSIGGMAGLHLAPKLGDRLERLVLLDTTAHAGDPDKWQARAQTVREAGSTEPIADAVVGRWVSPEFAAAEPDRVAALRAMLVASPAEGYASCCEAIGRHDARDVLKDISVPTVVVHATGDQAIPFTHGEQLAAGIPGARLQAVTPGGHIPTVEHPGLIEEAIA